MIYEDVAGRRHNYDDARRLATTHDDNVQLEHATTNDNGL